jgi:hypothetical protein
MRLDAVDAKKDPIRKALDIQAKAKTSAILLGTKVLFKLAGAFFWRGVGRNLGEILKEGKSQTFGRTKWGEMTEQGSTFEKGADMAALVQYNKALATQTLKAMKEVFTKGGSESDALFDSKELHEFKKVFEKGDFSLKALAGNYAKLAKSLHGAEKAPLALAEETYARERLMNNLRRETKNKNLQLSDLSEAKQWELKERAWKEGNEAKLMKDNAIAKEWTRLTDKTGKMGLGRYFLKTEGKVAIPIVKVPTNYVLEGLDYSFGLVKGLGEVVWRGIDGSLKDLPYEDKQRINKSITRGTLGAALSTYATLNPGQFVDDKGKFTMMFGVKIPPVLMHHPLFLSMKIAAETAFLYSKAKENGEGILGEVGAPLGGVFQGVQDIPFINIIDQIKYSKTIPKGIMTSADIFMGSTIVPQFVREAAKTMDMSEDDKKEVSNYLKNYFTGDKTVKREIDESFKGIFWQGMFEQNIPYLRENLKTKQESDVIKEAVKAPVESGKTTSQQDADDVKKQVKSLIKKNGGSDTYIAKNGEIIDLGKATQKQLDMAESELETQNEKDSTNIVKKYQSDIDEQVKEKTKK